MTTEQIVSYQRAIQSLPPYEKEILRLAREAVNNLGFAIQNAHNENAVYKYEGKSVAAMASLEALLLRGSSSFTPPG